MQRDSAPETNGRYDEAAQSIRHFRSSNKYRDIDTHLPRDPIEEQHSLVLGYIKWQGITCLVRGAICY
jgi:hypothetical protein